MSPGLVMAGTGGRAGPAGSWVAWTTTAYRFAVSVVIGERQAAANSHTPITEAVHAMSKSSIHRGLIVLGLLGEMARTADVEEPSRNLTRNADQLVLRA
jgi:hypothetical protein